MIRLHSLLLLLLLAISGCVHHHYYIKTEGTVVLCLEAPKAKRVLFASSTDRFRLREVYRSVDGIWIVDNLENREFQYFYKIDGKIYTPDCRFKVEDDFGATNCIYQPQ